MYSWFIVSVLGIAATVPIHFFSVKHLKLQEKYGKERGNRIGEILGIISGWGLFFFWVGIWISPQPRFIVFFLSNLSFYAPLTDLKIPLINIAICMPFLIYGAWLAIRGVKETTLKVAETHRTEKIVVKGVYSVVRHPQYLGGLLAHVGISVLLSASYSLLSTTFMTLLIYLISLEEEKELIKEFGEKYLGYKEKVPMLIPFLERAKKRVRARGLIHATSSKEIYDR